MPETEVEREEVKPRAKGGHRKLATVLVVVATLFTFIAIFSIWINRQALNTDNWVSTSSRLLQNEDVQTQLATFLSNQLFDNVDVEAQIDKALPPKLAPLAGPAVGGLHSLAPQIAQKAIQTSQFQTLWANANRAAHQTLLKVVDGGGDIVSTGGGDVTLDLGNLVAQIGSQLGVGSALASKLPADAGEITILQSNELAAAETGVKLIRRLPIVLTLLVLILYGLAIYLAGPRRRETLRAVGISFIVAGALVLVLRSLAGGGVVDQLAATQSVKPAVQATWDIGTSLLVTVAASALTFGILLVIGAWLAGPTRLATALRREGSPYVREHRLGTYGVAAAVFVALVAWAPIAALRKPFGLLLFAILLAIGTEILRRQILTEFPEGSGGGLGDRARERAGRLTAGITGRRDAPAAPPPEEAKVGGLERLAALHSSGGLTDEEFAKAKAELLG